MIVILGASGQLGAAFARLLPDSVCIGREQLDLTRPNGVRGFLVELRPSLVINCAAYTDVDGAESNFEIATLVNVDSVREIASATADVNARFVTFSTDYVFDGTKPSPYVESDPTAPINAYGTTKLAGESAALEVNPNVLVVRTSWILSGSHPNFASKILRAASRGVVNVVNDQIGHPTLSNDLARATMEALHMGLDGVVHLTNQGAVSWYDLARRIVELGDLDPNDVKPCSSSEFPRPARRPANSVLASERTTNLLPHFETELAIAVAELKESGRV